MRASRAIVTSTVWMILAMPVFAAEDDSKAVGQFQAFLAGLNDQSFEVIAQHLDQTDLSNRVLGHQPIRADIEEMFRSDFWSIVERGVVNVLPPQGMDAKGELVRFSFENGQGQAVVRYRYPSYEFQFHVFDLRHDRRSRLKVIDWFDSNKGLMFSAFMAEELLTAKPVKEATRRLLSMQSPSDLQLFQATELLKAIRDREAARFYDIYDEFDGQLRREPWIAKHAVFMAHVLQDSGRFASALQIFAEVFLEDLDMALLLSDFYVAVEDYEKSFAAMQRFEQHFSVAEGSIPAKLSALALAIGKPDDAERYAVKATANEPSFELGWWSLLRARVAAEDFEGALEPLTQLEDRFGYRLDEAKLRRDKFRAFTKLAISQQFRDWRAARD